MVRKKLVILSASSRIRRDAPKPLPALEAYDGIYFRILRKYLREINRNKIDVLIVSEKRGLICSHEKTTHYKPHAGKWGSLSLDKNVINELRTQNLEKLKKIMDRYEEIYVNVGKDYMKLIDGFEDFTSSKILYAKGKGLGPKAVHMKKYLMSQISDLH